MDVWDDLMLVKVVWCSQLFVIAEMTSCLLYRLDRLSSITASVRLLRQPRNSSGKITVTARDANSQFGREEPKLVFT